MSEILNHFFLYLIIVACLAYMIVPVITLGSIPNVHLFMNQEIKTQLLSYTENCKPYRTRKYRDQVLYFDTQRQISPMIITRLFFPLISHIIVISNTLPSDLLTSETEESIQRYVVWRFSPFYNKLKSHLKEIGF